MRVELWGEEKKKSEEVLRLRLVSRTDNVELVAVDEAGKLIGGGHIAAITNEGKMRLFGSISPEIPIQRDENDRIQVEKL